MERDKRAPRALWWTAIGSLVAAVGVIGMTAGVLIGRHDQQPAPPPIPAVADTPGAPCATSRLGRTFTAGGVTYMCQTPKPYHWLPSPTAQPTA